MTANRWVRAASRTLVPVVLLGTAACVGHPSAEMRSAPRPDSPCAVPSHTKPAKALLECGEQSVALIETVQATGTGIVVERDGQTYVLTNHHVVTPYDSADVVVGGVTDLGRVPLVGADIAADIALLGPIEPHDGVEALPLGDPQVAKGDDVFLVGFPGTIDVEEADLTITSGLVSRRRDAEEWDQTYIQSDALIGHGQSGGPLFAATGEVVGVSGLSFADGFALSLSIQDVDQAVDRILDGATDDVAMVPQDADGPAGAAGAGELQGDVTIDSVDTSTTLQLPASSRRRIWNLTLSDPGGGLALQVTDPMSGDVLAMSSSLPEALRAQLAAEAAEYGIDVETYLDEMSSDLDAEAVANEVSPGVFRIELDADQGADVTIEALPDPTRTPEAALAAHWTSDQPLWSTSGPHEVQPLTLGTPAEGVIGGDESSVEFRIDLQAGQRVEVSASSPQGDVAVAIGPHVEGGPGWFSDGDFSYDEYDEEYFGGGGGAPTEGVEWFDDSGEGLYGLDVLEEFTATAAGTYEVHVENYEYTPLAYRITVRAL